MPSIIWLAQWAGWYRLCVDPDYEKTFRMESSPECSLGNMAACMGNLKYDGCHLKCDLYPLYHQFSTPSYCSGKGEQESNIWFGRVSMRVNWRVWFLNHDIYSQSWEISCVEDGWFSEATFWALDPFRSIRQWMLSVCKTCAWYFWAVCFLMSCCITTGCTTS